MIGCRAGSAQQLVERGGQVVMVMAWTGQFAQGKPFQLIEFAPLLEADRRAVTLRGFLDCCRELLLLPRLRNGSWQWFGFPIGHRARAATQMLRHGRQRLGVVGPVHQLLPLLLAELKPMAEFELEADQIKLAPHTEGNAAPGADEVMLKVEAMAGLAHGDSGRFNW